MNDDIELLRRLGDALPDKTREAEITARAALAYAIASEDGGRPARSRPRILIRALVFACALALVVFVGATTLRSGYTAGPPEAAADVLRGLASTAANAPALKVQRGQYLYTASTSLNSSLTVLPGRVACDVTVRERRENWVARDGSGLIRERDSDARLTEGPRSACQSVIALMRRESTSVDWAAPGCMAIDPVSLAGLPTEPVELRRRLLSGRVEGGPPGVAEAFTQVGDLLRETDASPALRAALFRAAAGLAGVRNLGAVKDQLGRSGAGLAVDSHGIRHELIFQPRTGELMAEQDIAVSHVPGLHASIGSVADWSAYFPARVVSHMPESSPLPLSPRCIHGGETGRRVPGHPDESVDVGSSFLNHR